MKKFLAGLGLTLMIINGIGIAVSCIITPGILFSADATGYAVVGLVIWLAVFAGLFYLGYRLRRKAKGMPERKEAPEHKAAPERETALEREAAPKQTAAKRTEETTAAKRTAEPSRVPAAGAAAPAPAAAPVRQEKRVPQDRGRIRQTKREVPEFELTREGRLRLYRNARAANETMHTFRPVYSEVLLTIREGVPNLVTTRELCVEHGDGKYSCEEEKNTYVLPEEMRAALTPETVEEWVSGTMGRDCPVAWADLDLRPRLQEWCVMARRHAYAELPDCVYLAENPFPSLDDVGPDGLYNESGIGQWVRLKSGVSLHDAIPALSREGAKKAVAVLMERDENGQPPQLPAEDRLLCQQGKVWVCVPAPEGRILNLADGLEYEMDYEEWPGSADDAATYGRWWLTPIRMSPDCRSTSPAGEPEFTADCMPILYDYNTGDPYFADLPGRVTGLGPIGLFSPEWAWSRPGGRFVIRVNERHSVYRNGVRVYLNPDFTGEPDSVYWGDRPAYWLLAGFGPTCPRLWLDTKTNCLSLAEATANAAMLSEKLRTAVAVARVVEAYDKY